jgi:hypothetical protein
MARGAFISSISNADLVLTGSDSELTDLIPLGSNPDELSSVGSVSVQFTLAGSGQVTVTPVVQSTEDVPQIELTNAQFKVGEALTAGDYFLPVPLPVSPRLFLKFSETLGSAMTISNIRINVQ